MSKVSFTQTCGTYPVVVVHTTLEPYQLNLRSAFGTSHSLTTVRNNALITIQIGPFYGYGEIGLPPKKPLCYLADYNDIESYFNEYNRHLATYPRVIADYDPFHQLENRFFQSCRQEKESDDRHIKIVRLLFRALDECPANSQPSSRAARCGIEAGLLDIWGKIVQKPVFELIGAESPSGKPSFFTAALNTDISLIIDSTKGGFQSTPYIKIKLDADVEKGFKILEALRAEFGSFDIKKKWSIDANSAWTPEIALKYLDLLGKDPFKSIIYMLEQPFPVELTKVEPIYKEEIQKWKEVKEAYEKVGILVYADESVSLAEDIDKLLPIVHGVNIKLEKAGGIREALRAICVAQKHDLKIWIGMMVASRLSCNIPVHLFAFTDKGGDLDGSLLIHEQSHLFEGGFEWIPINHRGNNENHGLIKFPANAVGLGVNYKVTTL